MCHLQNVVTCVYHESVTSGQTHTQVDARQSNPYVLLCFGGDTKNRSFQGFDNVKSHVAKQNCKNKNTQETAQDSVAGLQSGNKIWEDWLRTS